MDRPGAGMSKYKTFKIDIRAGNGILSSTRTNFGTGSGRSG